MIVVDVNLLVYASNTDSAHHQRARRWWDDSLTKGEPVGLAWSVMLGFLRITTNPRVLPRPLRPEQAIDIIDSWFRQASVRIVEPTERHWDLVKELLAPLGTAANLTSDAHLAALAIEHGARLCSTDNDFDRFAGLRWMNPLALAGRAQERTQLRASARAAR